MTAWRFSSGHFIPRREVPRDTTALWQCAERPKEGTLEVDVDPNILPHSMTLGLWRSYRDPPWFCNTTQKQHQNMADCKNTMKSMGYFALWKRLNTTVPALPQVPKPNHHEGSAIRWFGDSFEISSTLSMSIPKMRRKKHIEHEHDMNFKTSTKQQTKEGHSQVY